MAHTTKEPAAADHRNSLFWGWLVHGIALVVAGGVGFMSGAIDTTASGLYLPPALHELSVLSVELLALCAWPAVWIGAVTVVTTMLVLLPHPWCRVPLAVNAVVQGIGIWPASWWLHRQLDISGALGWGLLATELISAVMVSVACGLSLWVLWRMP